MDVISNPNNSCKLEELEIGNVTFRSFYDNRVTEEDLTQARLELGETDEKKATSLLELKDKLKRDKSFHYRLDDEYLLRYLRYRKYDVKKAHAAVRNFYELRKERPDLFDIKPNLDFFLRQEVITCLPYRDEGGCIITWNYTNKWNLEEMSLWDLMAALFAISDVVSMNPSMQINGITSFWDAEGLTAGHIRSFASPSVLRIYLNSMQSSYPWRIKRIIIFNCNAIVRGFYKAIRYLINKKIADRIVLLGSDISELHQHLHPRILPKIYGGCLETSECASSFAQYIIDNLPYIKYERSFGPNTKV